MANVSFIFQQLRDKLS